MKLCYDKFLRWNTQMFYKIFQHFGANCQSYKQKPCILYPQQQSIKVDPL